MDKSESDFINKIKDYKQDLNDAEQRLYRGVKNYKNNVLI